MGQVALGPYVLLEKIAAGGMAEVFLAKRTGPGGFEKRVALKKILPHLAENPEFVRMFVEEARVAARLDHPNLVGVFDFGEVEGTLFLAMEYVPGITIGGVLRAAQRARAPVPLAAAAHVALCVLRGLDHLHGVADESGRPLGLVHRDVSPSNILVARSGDIKLGDFGIARGDVPEGDTSPGRLKGKLGYMAPELVLAKAADRRADLFAVATVLAELCMGRSLFAGGSELDVLLRIRDGDLTPILESAEVLGRDVQTLLLHALAVEPKDRFPTATAFAAGIQEVLAARGVSAGPSALVAYCDAHDLFVPRPSAPPSPEEESTPAVDPTGSIEIYVDPLVDRVEAAMERTDRSSQTSPAIYRLRAPDGAEVGPMSYPRVVEVLTAGEMHPEAQISVSGGAWRRVSEVAELTRFVTSIGLAWDAQEIQNVAAKGDLSKVSIPRLFYRLASMNETGVLHLRQGARRKKIYFVRGQPEFVGSTDRSELLGEWLVRRRICLRMEVDMALAMLPRFGGHLGDALVGLGILRPIELFRAIAAQVKDRLLEIFRWRQGEFVYAIGMQSHEETFPLGVDTFEIIGEGVATGYVGEELEGLLAPFQEKVLRRVPIPRVAVERFALPKRQERILQTIDGRKTLAGILARESLAGTADPEDVYRAVYLGLSCEVVEAG